MLLSYLATDFFKVKEFTKQLSDLRKHLNRRINIATGYSWLIFSKFLQRSFSTALYVAYLCCVNFTLRRKSGKILDSHVPKLKICNLLRNII